MNIADRQGQALLVQRQAPATNLLLRGGHLLDPDSDLDGPADLLIESGQIVELGPANSLECPAAVELVDAAGLHVFPGFLDPHVHLRTPGQEYKEDIDSGTRAAAAGGFCAVLAMPNTDPVVDDVSILLSLRERARQEARVPVGFFAAITKGQEGSRLTDMVELSESGAIGFSDDGVPVSSAGMLRLALQYQRISRRVLALHEEDPQISPNGVMHEGRVSARLGLPGIASVSESSAIERDSALVAYERGRCHVLHLSAAESVAAIARAKDLGSEVTAEVTPHHLLLTDEDVLGLDTNFKMNPPLRSERDRQALLTGLKDGTIDCIASDHAPHASEEKEQPFELAPMGVTGLETAFAALYTGLVRPGTIGLELLVRRLVDGARIFDLPRPSLAKGRLADLCLVDLNCQWQVGERGFESRSGNSCFSGRSLFGQVLLTLAGGQEAYRQREFALRVAERPHSIEAVK